MPRTGNLTQRQERWWDPNVSNYQYDPLNRVNMAEQGANGWIFARSWYQYDAVSREVATWRDEDNGMGSGKGERYWYDVTDQLTNVRYNADQVWTGNPVNWSRAMDYNYTSDRLNRASTVENGSVSGYQANALNQYASVNGQGIGYEGNFNITWHNGVSFSYDAQNRLVGGSMQATYDGLGRCVRRTTGSGTRLYTYDDWNPIFEWDQWGNFAGWNMYGSRPDEILMRWDAVHGPMIYKQDQHGNVVALLDSGGNIVERVTYDAFGKPRVTGFWDDNDRGGSWYGNRFLFTGREWIAELGIYDYRNRYYQPQLGRFLQTDPTGFGAGDMNLFRYCGDDPVDRSDPTGLDDLSYIPPGDTLQHMFARLTRIKDDVITVAAHGTSTYIMNTNWNHTWVNHEVPVHMRLPVSQLVKQIKSLKKYTPTMLIRLNICQAGDFRGAAAKRQPAVAQEVANGLRTNPVSANTGYVSAFDNKGTGTDITFGAPDSEHPTVLPNGPDQSGHNQNSPPAALGAAEARSFRGFDSYGSTTAAAAAWEASYGYGGWLGVERYHGR
jgi:RHS repeat-associated protein